jgi:hypothetical protein
MVDGTVKNGILLVCIRKCYVTSDVSSSTGTRSHENLSVCLSAGCLMMMMPPTKFHIGYSEYSCLYFTDLPPLHHPFGRGDVMMVAQLSTFILIHLLYQNVFSCSEVDITINSN